MNKLFFKLYYNPHFVDVNNIPSKGPVVLCGNHVDVLDKDVINCASKREIAWLNNNEDEVKTRLEKKGVVGVFPEKIINFYRLQQFKIMELEKKIVKINNSNMRGTDCMTEVAFLQDKINKEMEKLNNIKLKLKARGIDVINYDVLLPFDQECVNLAREFDAVIVPFAITGDYNFLSKNLKVRFGEPIKVDNNAFNDNNKVRDSVKQLIYKSY